MAGVYGSSELPARAFMEEANIKWRTQKPDFTLVNNKFMAEKSMKHAVGSIEKVVEDLVKTWEMELTHKVDKQDFGSVVPEKFSMTVNGEKKYDLEQVMENGTYNLLMADSTLYPAAEETFHSSHSKFKTAFNQGFPWEVIEVFKGPPRCVFSWRHWTHWTGPYGGQPGTGELMEMFGIIVANVTDDLKIKELDIYYDPNPFMKTLTGYGKGRCPVAHK